MVKAYSVAYEKMKAYNNKTMLELFSGSGIMAKTFKENGFSSTTVDNNPMFCPDILEKVNTFISKRIFREPHYGFYDVVWASPPCQAFSVASISKHWGGGYRKYEPKTKQAVESINLVWNTIWYISVIKPKYWFIENPRGVLRKVIDEAFESYNIKDYVRHTVTYCQYGDKRMKPTDIWTNCREWKPKPMCKNGSPCHEPAPRGSKTGTQGLKNAYERGKLPKELCKEIVNACKVD